MNMRPKVWVIVLLATLMLSVSQSVYADGTQSTTDGDHDLLLPAATARPIGVGAPLEGEPAPPQFYLEFLDIKEAHVTLSDGVYTFEITVQSTPPDWLSSTWNPVFPYLRSQRAIDRVMYGWNLRSDSIPESPTLQEFIQVRVRWCRECRVNLIAYLAVCPAGSEPACGSGGPAYQSTESEIDFFPPMTISIDQLANSVSVTLSQSDLSDALAQTGLPMATRWKARASAVGGILVRDFAPDPGQGQIPLP